jgi:hypothetical protein
MVLLSRGRETDVLAAVEAKLRGRRSRATAAPTGIAISPHDTTVSQNASGDNDNLNECLEGPEIGLSKGPMSTERQPLPVSAGERIS